MLSINALFSPVWVTFEKNYSVKLSWEIAESDLIYNSMASPPLESDSGKYLSYDSRSLSTKRTDQIWGWKKITIFINNNE